jgi:hypothetical protein
MTDEEKAKIVDILAWMDYEFGISEHYADADIEVPELKQSHRIADNKVAELLEMLGFHSWEEMMMSRNDAEF